MRYSAGKSAAGLLMVMLACFRGMFVSNLHRRDLAVWAEKKITGATEVK